MSNDTLTAPSVRNRCVRTVELRFFEDEANGEWGVTHKDTLSDDGGGDGFNAFWDAMGLFHDVFEHAHEHTNRYFRGTYAMNVGGEMAAMGAMWYYYSQLGLSQRLNNRSMYSPGDNMRLTTEGMIQEAIESDNTQFGSTLECNVPRQKDTHDYELESQIDEMWERVKGFKHDTHQDYSGELKDWERDAIERSHEYRKSVTLSKIRHLHRYGWHMARKLVGEGHQSYDALCDFWETFDTFCKRNKAEELAKMARGITVKLYRNSLGELSWKAWLDMERGSSASMVRINKHLTVEDLYGLFN